VSKSTDTAASGGISAGGLLGVAFVVLKLCHVIDWSWWWVTAPFWGPCAFLLAVAFVCCLCWFVAWCFE
jgi:hypothetical protein